MKTNKSGKLIVKIFMILLMVVVGLMILLPFWRYLSEPSRKEICWYGTD